MKKREARFGTKVHKRGREVIQAVALQIVLRLARPAPEMVVVREEEGWIDPASASDSGCCPTSRAPAPAANWELFAALAAVGQRPR
jgi:hypothetical protein